jgi:hypothetical protein
MFSTIVYKIIENQCRIERNIIYGAQSIRKQIGLHRPTEDYDIMTKFPINSAIRTRDALNKVYGNVFFIKPADHEETWKVMFKDKCVVDYTKLTKPFPGVVKINGLFYRHISEEETAKIKSVKDRNLVFRHDKDLDDLRRIERIKTLPTQTQLPF